MGLRKPVYQNLWLDPQGGTVLTVRMLRRCIFLDSKT